MYARVGELYAGGGGERCPGEADCTRGFAEAAGATRAEKEANICRGCDLFPTKPKFSIETDDTEVVDRIERIRNEQRAGAIPDRGKMSWLEWNLLVEWHRVEAAYERQYQSAVMGLMQAAMMR